MHTLYVIVNVLTGEELQTEDWDTFAAHVNQRDADGNLIYRIEYRTIYDA